MPLGKYSFISAPSRLSPGFLDDVVRLKKVCLETFADNFRATRERDLDLVGVPRLVDSVETSVLNLL